VVTTVHQAEFIFHTKAYYPYLFFSILLMLLVAILLVLLFFLQLKKTQGSVGVYYSDIHKSYLLSSIILTVITLALSGYLSFQFYRIFPIYGPDVKSGTSILFLSMVTLSVVVIIVSVVFWGRNWNKDVSCPYETHLNTSTLQCDRGCNNDGSNCPPGQLCLGNDCCPSDHQCGQSCCEPSRCFKTSSGKPFCCPSDPCVDSEGKTRCCDSGTICQDGQCLVLCGQDRACTSDEYCAEWNKIENPSQIQCSGDETNKIYDPDSKTLYCCMPKPSGSDCSLVTSASLPITGNYTSCYSTRGESEEDQQNIDQALQEILTSDNDAFAQSKIMGYGPNRNKDGYLCGFDGPIERAYQSIYQGEACSTDYLKCQDNLTTSTLSMGWNLSTEKDTPVLFCNQRILCNDQVNTDTEAKTLPSSYNLSEAVPDGTVDTVSTKTIQYKNPEDVRKQSSISKNDLSSTLFQKSCDAYPEINTGSLGDCNGTNLPKNNYLCAKTEDGAYGYTVSTSGHKFVCAPTFDNNKLVGYHSCLCEDETCSNCPYHLNVDPAALEGGCPALFADPTVDDDYKTYYENTKLTENMQYAGNWGTAFDQKLGAPTYPVVPAGPQVSASAVRPFLYFGMFQPIGKKFSCAHEISEYPIRTRMWILNVFATRNNNWV